MLIKDIKYYLGSRKDLIILAILNTFVLWQLSYYIFILFDRQFFFDSASYMSMARGNFNVILMHAHRIAIPFFASVIAKFIAIFNPQTFFNSLTNQDFVIRISFYLLNLLFSAAIFYFLFETLVSMRYRKLVILASILSLQLNTIYLYYIAVPNVDISVLFFISLGLFIYSRVKKFNKFFILFLVINIVASLFKEYIFLANFPILLLFIKKQDSKYIKNAIFIFSYLIINLLMVSIFRFTISKFVYLVLNTEFITYSKPFLDFLIGSIFPNTFNINKLQDIIQYSPFLVLIILAFRYSKNNNIQVKPLKKVNKNKYLNDFNLLTTLLIFLILSGLAQWQLRVFFPFYLYLLPFVCEGIDQMVPRKLN